MFIQLSQAEIFAVATFRSVYTLSIIFLAQACNDCF